MNLQNCDIVEFVKRIQKKKLICFGSGQGLRSFLSVYDELHIEDNIVYILDNDKSKHGTLFIYKEKAIPIMCYENMEYTGIKDESILLITSICFEQICQQLDCNEKICNVPCYIYSFIMEASYEYIWKKHPLPECYRRSDKMLIPKRIHYCWFGRNKIPIKLERYIETWKKQCPDYELILWNEDNYNINSNEYIMNAYLAKKWAFVSDAVRLDVVYRYGGIYLDTDIELLGSLDELLFQPGFMVAYQNGAIATGLGFGATKGNCVIKQLFDAYNTYQFNASVETERIKTCSQHQTEIMEQMGYVRNAGYQIVNDIAIYPCQLIMNESYITREKIYSPKTIGVHHSEVSWMDDKNLKKVKCRNTFYMNNYDLLH